MELPQYTVYVETPRLLLPKVLSSIFLSLVLYVAIWINFLFMKKPMPFYIIIVIVVFLILVVFISTIYNYAKYSNHHYKFYMNHIEYSGDIQHSIMYSQISNIQIRKDFFDILFKTGTIDLGGFKIRSIPNLNQVFFYVQKMVQVYNQNSQAYQNQQSSQGGYAASPQSQYPSQNYQNQYPSNNPPKNN